MTVLLSIVWPFTSPPAMNVWPDAGRQSLWVPVPAPYQAGLERGNPTLPANDGRGGNKVVWLNRAPTSE